MDMQRLVHLPRNVQELLSAAVHAWRVWDNRPALIVGEKVNPESKAWMLEQRKAMNELGATLMPFGLYDKKSVEKEK